MDRDFNPIRQIVEDGNFVRQIAESLHRSPLDLAEGHAKGGSPQIAGIFLDFVPDAMATKARKAEILAEAYANKAAQLAEEANGPISEEWKEYYSDRAAKALQIAQDLKSISQSG